VCCAWTRVFRRVTTGAVSSIEARLVQRCRRPSPAQRHESALSAARSRRGRARFPMERQRRRGLGPRWQPSFDLGWRPRWRPVWRQWRPEQQFDRPRWRREQRFATPRWRPACRHVLRMGIRAGGPCGCGTGILGHSESQGNCLAGDAAACGTAGSSGARAPFPGRRRRDHCCSARF